MLISAFQYNITLKLKLIRLITLEIHFPENTIKAHRIMNTPIITRRSTEPCDINFFQKLVALVYKRKQLWDRVCTDKELKQQLWRETAKILGIETEICISKWKGLREKYLRQKKRYIEGGEKWELLDAMSFLDSVISYRKRFPQFTDNYSNDSQYYEQFSLDSDGSSGQVDNENVRIKTEEQSLTSADNTLDGNIGIYRKRAESSESSERDELNSKKRRCEHMRTPEEVFGEFVGASLASKSESDKNAAMIQIMIILTGTN